MAKFCMKCGTPLQEGVKFCHKCGTTIEGAATQQPPTQQQPMASQQPYYGQTQPYAPIPAKSNKKLIIGVIAIVAIIVIIGLLVFFFVLGGDDSLSDEEKQIAGTWNAQIQGTDFTMIYTFNSDHTIETGMAGVGTGESGTWEAENGKITFTLSMQGTGQDPISYTYDYELTNSGNTLLFKVEGTEGVAMTLTK